MGKDILVVCKVTVGIWAKVCCAMSNSHAHKHTVMDVQWNRNGNWLLTASRDQLIKLFDVRNLKHEMQNFKGHMKEASGLIFSYKLVNVTFLCCCNSPKDVCWSRGKMFLKSHHGESLMRV